MQALRRTTVKVFSAFLSRYLRITAPLLRVGVRLPDGSVHEKGFDEVNKYLESLQDRAPAICLLWTSDHLNLLALGYSSAQLLSLSRRFEFFTDDSVGGLIMRACLAQLELISVPLSEDPVERLKLLRDFMLRRPATFLIVDGRGPYFHVAPGIISLARTLRAPLVPCSVAAVPRLLLPNIRVPISLPLPGSRVLLSIGLPIWSESLKEDLPTQTLNVAQALQNVRSQAYLRCSGASL